MTVRWNADKPHRCPSCHTVVVQSVLGRRRRFLPSTYSASSLAVYECCRCGVRFTRWPALALILPLRRCTDIAAGQCPHPTREARP